VTNIKCFWLEPTEKEKRFLRRYNATLKCSGPMGYHDAMVFLDESRETMSADGAHWVDSGQTAADFAGHALWPTHCACGYEFQPGDERQLFTSHLYRRADTCEEMTLRDAPDGAMWEASWYSGVPSWCGPDGRAIICRAPTKHDWHIDGPANNCTRPNDEAHRCWVRHGVPPNLTVDKNGNTCSAGAGSILTPAWHGFLRNGELVPC
jgi:hypothetical protein